MYGDHGYGQSSYGQPPQQYPPSGPQLPPGWISQWDLNSQRYYYLEQATGRTQWEAPTGGGWGGPPAPPGGAPGYYQSYGHAMPGVPPVGGHDDHSRAYYGTNHQEKKGSGTGKLIAAGVGGAALGALAVGALDDSDDGNQPFPAPLIFTERRHHNYQTTDRSNIEAHTAAAPAAYGGGYGAPPPAAPAPVPLEDNPELSSSQRSSLEEAREDVEEAQKEVAEDSNPSSSDVEELQEAQEEYASEVESAHEELED